MPYSSALDSEKRAFMQKTLVLGQWARIIYSLCDRQQTVNVLNIWSDQRMPDFI